jgi:hypothetical protein
MALSFQADYSNMRNWLPTRVGTVFCYRNFESNFVVTSSEAFSLRGGMSVIGRCPELST